MKASGRSEEAGRNFSSPVSCAGWRSTGGFDWLTNDFPAPLAEWYRVRDALYRDIFENFSDPERQAFVQHKGSRMLDAG